MADSLMEFRLFYSYWIESFTEWNLENFFWFFFVYFRFYKFKNKWNNFQFWFSEIFQLFVSIMLRSNNQLLLQWAQSFEFHKISEWCLIHLKYSSMFASSMLGIVWSMCLFLPGWRFHLLESNWKISSEMYIWLKNSLDLHIATKWK